jgi:flagellar L-ring protein precursor FlgH
MTNTLHSRLILLGLLISLSGCASFGKKLKAFLGGKSDTSTAATPSKGTGVKYSDSPNVYSGARRQYKRTTRESLAQEAALEPQAGSLWVMEGQGSYLFAQNTVRMIGDPIAVTLEGDPKDQLQAKVDVIRKLWSKFEERQARLRAPANDESSKDGAKGDKDPKAAEAGKDAGKAKETTAAQAPAAQSPEQKDLGVKIVPTRVVERTIDGNYRVKGSQPIMIGPREYKVIVTGIIRAEDFNEEGIGASKLLDAKYDVVSVRRKEDI